MKDKKFQLSIKRIFDFVCAFIMIIVLSPLLIILAVLVKLSSPGKAVFAQERMGKDEKRFMIYKFRTMKNPPEGTYCVDGVLYKPNGDVLEPSITRVTKIGKVLRKTSLDELMQLVNVLNGTMSLVGPRPTLPYQSENYSEEQKRRFKMRPGVTGLAQINGRNALTWTEKIQYDLEYVESFSIWLDIKILFKTVAVVLKKEEIDFDEKQADPLTEKK